MELKVEMSKTYKVGDKEYSSREEALKASAMELLHEEIPKGFDNVVSKATDIIKALNIVKKDI